MSKRKTPKPRRRKPQVIITELRADALTSTSYRENSKCTLAFIEHRENGDQKIAKVVFDISEVPLLAFKIHEHIRAQQKKIDDAKEALAQGLSVPAA